MVRMIIKIKSYGIIKLLKTIPRDLNEYWIMNWVKRIKYRHSLVEKFQMSLFHKSKKLNFPIIPKISLMNILTNLLRILLKIHSRKLLPNSEKLFCLPKIFFCCPIQIIIKTFTANSFSEFGNNFLLKTFMKTLKIKKCRFLEEKC